MSVLLLVLSVATGIWACPPKTFSGYPKYIDANPDGWYSLKQPGDVKCSERYITLASLRNSRAKSCFDSQFSPAEVMQFGISKVIEEDLPNRPVMQFECERNIITKEPGMRNNTVNKLNLQELNHVSYKESTYGHRETAKNWIMFDDKFIEEYLPDKIHFYNTIVTEPEEKKKILQVQYRSFKATVSSAYPSKGLLYSYRSLPKNLYENITLYLNFVLTYGCYVRISTVFGGVLEIDLGDYNKDILKSEIETHKFINNFLAQNSSYFMVGGEKSSDISSWKASVKSKPKPLLTDFITIYDFVEPNTESEKKQSLKSMVHYLENRATLKLVKNILEKEGYDHKLSDFLIHNINSELNFICTSDSFVELIKNDLLMVQNLKFKRFFILCMHDISFCTEKGEECVLSDFMSLIEGLCFSRENIGKCMRAEMSYPTGTNCMNFYETNNCQGIPLVNISYDIAKYKLAATLQKSQSFSFC